jgi:hypothetical protein
MSRARQLNLGRSCRPGCSLAVGRSRGSMVTRTQINRLSSRIEGLAEQLGLAVVPRYNVWLSFDGESDEEFYARHPDARAGCTRGSPTARPMPGRAAGDECNFLLEHVRVRCELRFCACLIRAFPQLCRIMSWGDHPDRCVGASRGLRLCGKSGSLRGQQGIYSTRQSIASCAWSAGPPSRLQRLEPALRAFAKMGRPVQCCLRRWCAEVPIPSLH